MWVLKRLSCLLPEIERENCSQCWQLWWFWSSQAHRNSTTVWTWWLLQLWQPSFYGRCHIKMVSRDFSRLHQPKNSIEGFSSLTSEQNLAGTLFHVTWELLQPLTRFCFLHHFEFSVTTSHTGPNSLNGVNDSNLKATAFEWRIDSFKSSVNDKGIDEQMIRRMRMRMTIPTFHVNIDLHYLLNHFLWCLYYHFSFFHFEMFFQSGCLNTTHGNHLAKHHDNFQAFIRTH